MTGNTDSTQPTIGASGDVAIIGMACEFPKAPDLQRYWQNIVCGVDAIDDPPPDRGIDAFYDPQANTNDRIYCKRGGYLADLPQFNPLDFGIMPVAVDGAEPEHFIALKTAHAALQDAGFPEMPLNRERTAVILGRGTYVNRGYVGVLQHGVVIDQTIRMLAELHPEYSSETLETLRSALKNSLPPFNAVTAPGLVPNVMSGLIANRLDLRGPNYVVDAACASALIAMQMGVQDLLSGKCDAVLTGGVQISTTVFIHMIFTQLEALSHLPQLRPFDENADGTMLSEGIGMVVLKRKEDAERDGHRIYALIKGIGSSSDGRAKGILAPRVEGEELALRRAYEDSGVMPNSVGLIEAHGTGLPVGDATEIEAIKRVFNFNDKGTSSCAIGTVKSMIGHLIPAAGVAGIIKTAMALHHKLLPPTLHCDTPNPRFGLERTGLYINTETRPWIHGGNETPRRAGVNAFGFGGINSHAVLEEYLPAADAPPDEIFHNIWDTELCIFQAASRQALVDECQRVLDYLKRESAPALSDIAYTLNEHLNTTHSCLAIVASSPADLLKKLEHAIKRLLETQRQRIKDRSGIYFFESALGRSGKLAFLFPGEGSQYLNMLADICLHFPEARRCFDLLDRAYAGHSRNYLPSNFIFPSRVESQANAEASIFEMDGAVDAVTTANRALFNILSFVGINPDMVLGHSSGEFMALEAAGALVLGGEDELIGHIRAGNRMIDMLRDRNSIPEGALLAVGGISLERVQEMIDTFEGDLSLAMDNCPHQFVLYSRKSSIEKVTSAFRKQGGICQLLPFDRAYHTPLYEPVLASLQEFFDSLKLRRPQIPIYSCMTARPYPSKLKEIRRLAVGQWARRVRFRETIKNMYADGVRIFVEVGPRSNLTSFVNDILKGKAFLAAAANVHHRSGITQLNHLLGLLAASGTPMELGPLYRRRMARRLDFNRTQPPSDNKEVKKGAQVLNLALPTLTVDAGLIQEMQHGQTTRCDLSAIGNSSGSAARPSAVNPHQEVYQADHANVAMQAYLRTMEGFLETQHQIMQAYLNPDSAGPDAANYSAPFADADKNAESAALTAPQPGQAFTRSSTAMDDGAKQSKASGAGASAALYKADLPQASLPKQILDQKGLQEILLQTISNKTGYPVDMIEVTHNLEADLGIDSIKRVEILGSVLQQIEIADDLTDEASTEYLNTLKTPDEIIEFLSTRLGGGGAVDFQEPAGKSKSVTGKSVSAPPPPTASLVPAALPLISEIIRHIPGEEITAASILDPRRDRYLQDHTLGGQVSRDDPTLMALPVLPFSMSVELMAEAAALLVPGLELIAMKNIHAQRWIILDQPSQTLFVQAARAGVSDGEIHVSLYVQESPATNPDAPVAMEASIFFAEAYPQGSGETQNHMRIHTPPQLSRDQFYPHALFHGPFFQSVKSLIGLGTDGAEALLTSVPTDTYLKSSDNPQFLSDPVLLDGAGQVVGLWANQQLDTDYVVFPVSIAEIRFFVPGSSSPPQAFCHVKPTQVDNDYIRSDAELVKEDGSLHFQIRGMQHKRIQMPEIFHLFRGSRAVMLSSQWSAPAEPGHDRGTLKCCRLNQFSEALWEADGGIWPKMLAHIVLSARERRLWQDFAEGDPARKAWLSNRIVSKEAVRLALKAHSGLDIWPADIDLLEDQKGRLRVSGKWTGQVKATPSLAVAQTDSMAVALALVADESVNVGFEVAHLSDFSAGLLNQDLLSEEKDFISKCFGSDAAEWSLRIWCAKKALITALGKFTLSELNAFQIDAKVGSIELKIQANSNHDQHFKEINWAIHTYRHKDIIAARAICHGGIGRKLRNGENGTGSTARLPGDINSRPFLDEIIEMETGEHLTALRHFDLNEDIFLWDHTLGRDISVTDKDLTGLPIMPLTISMEMMAEAAGLLQPDDLLIGMRDIRAYRWIGFDEDKLTLRIDARRKSPAEIEVKIWDSVGASSLTRPVGMPAIEGRMVFGQKYPDPPAAGEFKIKQQQLSLWPPNKLYTEGMFHGPRFQAVDSMDSIGANGAEGTIRALPWDAFFSARTAPNFITDHIVLDAAGQLLAYWFAQQHPDIGFNTYPYHIQALDIYGPHFQAGDLACGRVSIMADTSARIRANIDVHAEDGSLRLQLKDWEDRPFRVPEDFYIARFKPGNVILSKPWPEAVSDMGSEGTVACFRMQDYAQDVLHAHGKIWLRVMAHLALSRLERKIWRKRWRRKKKCADWLFACIAIKDAVRVYLKRKEGIDLLMPDIEIKYRDDGQVYVAGNWTRELASVPIVSLSHASGVGVALLAEKGTACGIHLSSLKAAEKIMDRQLLTGPESEQLRSLQLHKDRQWLLRLWGAKQAVVKAYGRYLVNGAADLTLNHLEPHTGKIYLNISAAILREHPQLSDDSLQVSTLSENQLVLAGFLVTEGDENGKSRQKQ